MVPVIHLYSLLGLILTVHWACAQLDKSVCTPVTASQAAGGPTKPVLPETYTARVEANILNKGKSTDVIEYFDFPNDRGTVIQTDVGLTAQLVYDYKTNELFTIVQDQNYCTVDTLTKDSNNFLFGYQVVNHTTRIFSANGALRFGGDTKEQYIGKSVVRGMQVNGWQSCNYWADLKATSKVTWYFTDSTAWQEAIGSDQLPVRCEITGKAQDQGGTSHEYHHIYEFSHFRPFIDADLKIFETPIGNVCPGRKSTVPLPVPANYFQFDAEILIPEAKLITRVSEWYDYTTKLFGQHLKPLTGFNPSPYAPNPMLQVTDYNTGVTYATDILLGNCSASLIDPLGVASVPVNDQTVRMRKPEEFFDFNFGGYEYEGVHQAGSVDCDVWITSGGGYLPGTNLSRTTEWYFATKQWTEGSGNLYQAGNPKRLDVRVNNQQFSTYNIYNYNEAEPVLWDFDISACFTEHQRKHFQFELPANMNLIIASNEQAFKYAVLLSLVGYTVVSPLRITDITVDYDEVGILVTFTMLDVAPIVGNVQMGARETPLEDAAALFTTSVQTGQFIVEMPVKSLTEPVRLTAKSNSVKELQIREWLKSPIPPTPNGYKPGSMAALAIIMALIGFAIGGAVMFIIYKKHGGAFSFGSTQPFPSHKFENPINEEKTEKTSAEMQKPEST